MDVWKKSFRKIWDNQGYAYADDNLMKLMRMPMSFHHLLIDWVKEWNQEHNINPLKYLEDDGYKFHQSEISPHIYVCDESRTLHITEDSISSDVYIHRVNVNTKDTTLEVWFEIDSSTIVDGGRTLDELYPVEDDDDDYFRVLEEYRNEFLWLTAKHFQKNYTDKMGYVCEIEFT